MDPLPGEPRSWLEVHAGEQVLLRDADFCVFLDPYQKCGIYEQRPNHCRTYPYLKTTYHATEIDVDFSCPGLGHGDGISESFLQASNRERNPGRDTQCGGQGGGRLIASPATLCQPGSPDIPCQKDHFQTRPHLVFQTACEFARQAASPSPDQRHYRGAGSGIVAGVVMDVSISRGRSTPMRRGWTVTSVIPAGTHASRRRTSQLIVFGSRRGIFTWMRAGSRYKPSA